MRPSTSTDDDIDTCFGEEFIVEFFLRRWRAGDHRGMMPWSDPSTDAIGIVQPKHADGPRLVLYHVDGTATVIEVKEGSKGYQHVASAIGQATLHAAQIAQCGSAKFVRRAVLWTALPSDLDPLMAQVCRDAAVTPIALGDLKAVYHMGFGLLAFANRALELSKDEEFVTDLMTEVFTLLRRIKEKADGTPL